LPAAGGSITIDPIAAASLPYHRDRKSWLYYLRTNPQTVVVGTCEHPEVTFTNTCHATLKITKAVVGTAPADDWAFTSDIPSYENFTLPAAGAASPLTPSPRPTYHITEIAKAGYTISETNPQTVVVGTCEHPEVTFTNTCHATLKIPKRS